MIEYLEIIRLERVTALIKDIIKPSIELALIQFSQFNGLIISALSAAALIRLWSFSRYICNGRLLWLTVAAAAVAVAAVAAAVRAVVVAAIRY